MIILLSGGYGCLRAGFLRIAQTERIIGDFTAEESPNQIYMITGVRGSGKTVMMTNIASEII